MGATNRMTSKNLDQIADAGAAISIGTFLGLSLGQWETIVNIGAGFVAILAGGAAFWYHIAKTRQLQESVDKVEEVQQHVADKVDEIAEDIAADE